MEFLYQRSWHVQVERVNDRLISSCHYLDSFEEKSTELIVNISDYSIQEAKLMQLGYPEHFTESTLYLDGLHGVSAYTGSGPEVRRILQPILSAQDTELINQCIIGAFQSETFIYNERGFVSAEKYSQAGDEYLKGTCRYYSNLERINNSWSNYIGQPERSEYLFNRFKNQQLMATEEEYWLIGSLSDPFHQVNTFLRLRRPDQCVIDAQGQLLKAPDQVCRESNAYLQYLAGINILQLSKKELAHRLGAQSGCVHLIDLVYDSGETLKIYNKSRA